MKNSIIISTALIFIFSFGYLFYQRTKPPVYKQWGEHRKSIETLNFRSGSIGPVKLGGDYKTIEYFGRPQNDDVDFIGEYRYYSSGLEFLADEEVNVLAFKCIFFDYWNTGYLPSKIILETNNSLHQIDSNTTEDDLINIIGSPNDVEIDDDLKVLYYYFDKFYYEIDILPNGKLSYIHAYLSK